MPPGQPDRRPWAAVVLAGGRARRLGGVDKVAFTIAGRTLLDGVLDACHGAEPVVVVGPRRPTGATVTWAREDPPHTGPLAALAAGLAAMPAAVDTVAVLAADLPGLRRHTVHRLRAALTPATSGALLVDATGHRQWLCGVWWTAGLRAALAAAGDPTDRSVRAVLGPLGAVEVVAGPAETADVDTPQDLIDLHSRHTAGPVV